MRRPSAPRRKADPTITLINVVFLMLTFFLIAGSVAPPVPAGLTLIRLTDTDPLLPPGVLAVTATGRMIWQGGETTPEAYAAALPATAQGIARILPDRDLPARDLLRIARALRAAGAAEVRILSERTLR